MRMRSLLLSLVLLPVLPCTARAGEYERPVNLITSNYDLVDTTYIDRGRLDGVKIGDRFAVKFRDGKLATVVVVTGVFERMASVKIVDNWLLKDGQLADYNQRPMIVALEPNSRRSASEILAARSQVHIHDAKVAAPSVAAPAGSGLPAAADAGLPPAAGTANTDSGLPPTSNAGVSPDAGLPPASGAAAAPDAGLPPAPGAAAAPDAGLPPAPGAAAAPDAGLPPASGAAVAPDAGLPPAPDAAPASSGSPNIPPPPE
jgi:hypothetical protein